MLGGSEQQRGCPREQNRRWPASAAALPLQARAEGEASALRLRRPPGGYLAKVTQSLTTLIHSSIWAKWDSRLSQLVTSGGSLFMQIPMPDRATGTVSRGLRQRPPLSSATGGAGDLEPRSVAATASSCAGASSRRYLRLAIAQASPLQLHEHRVDAALDPSAALEER